jgi:hypothetical protein
MADDRDDELIGDEAGTTTQGSFADPSGSVPPKGYWYQSSLNKGWKGANNKRLSYAGVAGKSLGITSPELPTSPTKTDINMTPSGHIIEYNDTPGGERILIKHKSGAGIDMLPDGSIGISVGRSHVMTIKDDMTIIVSGNASYDFRGDVDFKVGGNFNISALNMNVNLKGNLTETIKGNHRATVTKNKGTVVQKNNSLTVLDTNAVTVLGNMTNIVKGTLKQAAEGNIVFVSGAETKITSQSKLDISSPSANIAAESLLLMGSTGTIGGEGIVMYGKGATFGEGVTAPTFHGDLDGTADVAATSLHQSYPDGSGPGYSPSTGSRGSITNTATPTTVLPTSSVLSDYLNVGGNGVVNVSIDATEITNVFNLSSQTGGLSTTELSTSEIRSRVRDPNNRSNQDFIANAVATGKLNPNYAVTTPPSTDRIAPRAGTERRGAGRLGNRGTSSFSDFTPSGIPSNKRFVPDLNYIILDNDDVTSATRLADGITVSTFLSGSGEVSNFNTTPRADRVKVARNLQANAYVMKWINNNRTNSTFSEYTLQVVEGYYVPSATESLEAEDIKDLATKGRAVVYELINNSSGQVDNRKTFELAVYLKDIIQYDKLILDYDNYNPDGSINVQVIVVMPEMNNFYRATFQRQIETRYNNAVQSNSDFVEIGEDGQITTTSFTAEEPITDDQFTGENGRLNPANLTSIGGTHRLRSDAARAYIAMRAAAQADGITWSITDSYRTYETQVRLARELGLYSEGGLAARPGTSNHGWGLALDLGGGVNRNGTPQNNWLRANANRFGFFTIPREPWHWEFRGSEFRGS